MIQFYKFPQNSHKFLVSFKLGTNPRSSPDEVPMESFQKISGNLLEMFRLFATLAVANPKWHKLLWVTRAFSKLSGERWCGID